jgi:hypothetical protein
MAKVIGPLHSEKASGTLAKAITFGFNRAGNWARATFKKVYRNTQKQNIIRTLFKKGLTIWNEVYKPFWGKYNELGVHDINLWNKIARKNKRSGRCEFMSEYMKNKGEKWDFYPLPLKIPKIIVTDKIWNYDKIISDLETLTELELCVRPIVLKIDMPFLDELGAAYMPGLMFSITPEIFASDGYCYDRLTVAHELTHCLLMQHGYYNFFFVHKDHEIIANECAQRVAEGRLRPVYTYKGKTLAEIVPFPRCP